MRGKGSILRGSKHANGRQEAGIGVYIIKAVHR